MNTAVVAPSVTAVAVSDSNTSVVLREVPVATVYYWLSQWQITPVHKEVLP